ncbi:MAG: efflux RND transporter periplasmic adaptor subunit [Acidobacteriota bacterium]
MADTVEREKNGGSSKKKIIALLVVLVVAGALGYWWFANRHLVSTDNAYAKADSAQIASRVPGTVVRVLVDNDRPVKAGDPLVELDPSDYELAVQRAEASLAENEAEYQAAEVMVPMTDKRTAAQIEAAEATLKAARETERANRQRLAELKSVRTATSAEFDQVAKDAQRFESLYKQGASTERQQDQASTALKKSRANLAAADAQVAAVEASLAGAVQEISRAEAQLQAIKSERPNVEVQRLRTASLKAKRDKAKAELETARLNLSYCTVKAPVTGYVAQKTVQVGTRVQTGQPLMAVVPLAEVYVEANFKETQLRDVRIGQPATISADIYPGRTFHGVVEGIRSGTGAAFSLLPSENATGNWIKVVQRIPVKIRLAEPPTNDFPLRVGSSLEVEIDTSDKSGAVLVTSQTPPVAHKP